MKYDTKICSNCKEEKSLEEFSGGKGKFRKKNYCKPCDRQYNKKLYLQNQENRIAQIQEWNGANIEKVKQYKKEWRRRKQKIL